MIINVHIKPLNLRPSEAPLALGDLWGTGTDGQPGRPVKVPSSKILVAPAASRVSRRPRELLGNMWDPLGNSSSADTTAA